MENTTKTPSVLHDLIQINNDRYNGFQKAAEDVDSSDLKDTFKKFSDQSLEFKNELERHTSEHVPVSDTSVASKLHRVWIDLKSAVTGKDRHSVLAAAEFGEDQILSTYRDALETGSDLPSDVLAVVQKQKQELQQAHNTIKSLRDSSAK